MLHEPLRAVGRQSTLLHAVQHGGVSCMGVTNPSLALSGHARQFRAETLCSAKSIAKNAIGYVFHTLCPG